MGVSYRDMVTSHPCRDVPHSSPPEKDLQKESCSAGMQVVSNGWWCVYRRG